MCVGGVKQQVQKCFPSQELIGKELSIHPRTVRRYLKLFEKHKLIEVEREKAGGLWVGNTYWLLDKTEWVSRGTESSHHQRTQDAVSEDTGCTDQRAQSPHKDTKVKNTKEEDIAGASPADVVSVIDSFKGISIAYKKWYGNTTQRKSIKNLIDSYGLDKVLKVVAFLPKSNGREFFPTITTPLQLEDKWAALEIAAKRISGKEKNYVI